MSGIHELIQFLLLCSTGVAGWIFRDKFKYFLTKQIFESVIFIVAVGAGAIWFFWDAENPENVRNVILLIGVLGGAYGILLASERQKTFSKQIDNAQEQLFNERLGRGVELLSSDNMTMRQTGIRVLEDLAENLSYNQQSLIAQILIDFIRERVVTKYKKDKNGKEINDPKTSEKLIDPEYLNNRQDIIIAIVAANLLSVNLSFDDSKRSLAGGDLHKLSFFNQNLSGAYFTHINFSKAIFYKAILYQVDFTYANLSDAKLVLSEIEQGNFYKAVLNDAKFYETNLENSSFESTISSNTCFTRCNMQNTLFTASTMENVEFINADLTFAGFISVIMKNINFFLADCSGARFLLAEGITQDQFDEIIFHKDNPPSDLPDGLELPKNRAYIWSKDEKGDLKRQFVESDAEWSSEWIEYFEKKYRFDHLYDHPLISTSPPLPQSCNQT